MMAGRNGHAVAPGRGTRGETITEVLVSVLIAGLALLMLATVIASVVNIVNNSDESVSDFYEASSQFAEMGGGDAAHVASGSGNVSLTDGSGSAVNWSSGVSGSAGVKYVYNEDTGAIAYEAGGGE